MEIGFVEAPVILNSFQTGFYFFFAFPGLTVIRPSLETFLVRHHEQFFFLF